jgi:hypothetical protein
MLPDSLAPCCARPSISLALEDGADDRLLERINHTTGKGRDTIAPTIGRSFAPG